MTQDGFENDACLSANQITARQMRAIQRASSKHQFENQSQLVQVHV